MDYLDDSAIKAFLYGVMFACFFSLCVIFIFWERDTRINNFIKKVIYDKDSTLYAKLPPLDYMVYRFWINDLNEFLTDKHPDRG